MLIHSRPIITILGGMGPMAGIELHKRIILNTPAKQDQDHVNIHHISFPSAIHDRTEYLKSHVNPHVNPHVNSDVNPGLQAGELFKSIIPDNKDKYIVGVPCNTFHSPIIFNLFKDIVTAERSNIEIVNMVESTVKYIQDKKYKNVGLLSTAGTRKTRVYQNLIQERGMHTTMVAENQQMEVDDIIYNDEYGIKSLSYATNNVTNKTKGIIDDLINEGANSIILGCTELPIAVTDKYHNNVEMINPVDILAREMLKKYKTLY